jgi:putative transposase
MPTVWAGTKQSGESREMARFARVVAIDIAHHVTQRGNARRYILSTETDREVYLELLRENCEQRSVSLIGYCLMSNHVHLVITPHKADSMASALKLTHGRYATYWNAKHGSSGHVWQGRYYSCPLDRPHLWEALRYTELNPVRAGLVALAELWPWSSAATHCGATAPDGLLTLEPWTERWDVSSWREYLLAGETEEELLSVRQSTHTGRPLGSQEFVWELEKATERKLAPRKGGRPARQTDDERQSEFSFEP